MKEINDTEVVAQKKERTGCVLERTQKHNLDGSRVGTGTSEEVTFKFRLEE